MFENMLRSCYQNGIFITLYFKIITVNFLVKNLEYSCFYFQIDKNLMASSGMVNRVRQEVAIHSRLKHPSILELYTFFEDSDYVYLVLELAHNGELQRYIKNNMLTITEEEGFFLLSTFLSIF